MIVQYFNIYRLTQFMFLVVLSLPINVLAQSVGINNTNPESTLDLNGRFRIRPENALMSAINNTLPTNTVGYFSLTGAVASDFNITIPAAPRGSVLLIENNTSFLASAPGDTRIQPGKAELFVAGASGWITAHDNESQLERIRQGSNTGWRIFSTNPTTYRNIGQASVDLASPFTNSGSSYGATGNNAFISGIGTLASGDYATSMGRFTAATGDGATAFGVDNRSIGEGSTTGGISNDALGLASTSFGFLSRASGTGATAIGNGVVARSSYSVALGSYNDSAATSATNLWSSQDPLFALGNGIDDADRRNAITVFKNGNTDINGFVRLGETTQGAPRVKFKRISTILNSAGNATIAHGVTVAKIIDMRVRVTNQFTSYVFDGNTIANNAFNAYLSGANVIINSVTGNNGDIVNRTAVVFLTYEE